MSPEEFRIPSANITVAMILCVVVSLSGIGLLIGIPLFIWANKKKKWRLVVDDTGVTHGKTSISWDAIDRVEEKNIMVQHGTADVLYVYYRETSSSKIRKVVVGPPIERNEYAKALIQNEFKKHTR